MRSSINRLRRLLQQVLDFRKVESGNMKLKLSNGDTWTARPAERGELEPGTVVRVSRIDGATAYVRPDEQESSA